MAGERQQGGWERERRKKNGCPWHVLVARLKGRAQPAKSRAGPALPGESCVHLPGVETANWSLRTSMRSYAARNG